MKFYKVILLFISIASLVSCATFDKNVTNPHKITIQNVRDLEGVYTVVPASKNGVVLDTSMSVLHYENFLTQIDRKLLKDTLRFDPKANYSFKLTIASPKMLTVDYLKNDVVYRSRNIKTRITKDGYLLLRNKNTGVVCVPFVLGAFDFTRTRLTLDKASNLVFDVSTTRTGAALLVVFADYNNRKFRLTYAPIHKLPI